MVDIQCDHQDVILLRDGFIEHKLPRKNDLTFEFFSKRGSEYIWKMKLKIDSNTDGFHITYNSFDSILVEKAKTEITQILSSVRKRIYLHDSAHDISPFLCFAGIYLDQYFLSFRQWIIEGLGDKCFETKGIILHCPRWLPFLDVRL